MTSTEQPTIEHKVEAAINLHDIISSQLDSPEIRVYETKTSRKLASGEIREYTIKQHYVVKKKAGICKTEIKKRESKLRKGITDYFHNLNLSQLQHLHDVCEKLNSNFSQEYLDQRGGTERAWYCAQIEDTSI